MFVHCLCCDVVGPLLIALHIIHLTEYTQDYNILYNAKNPDLRVVTEPTLEQKLNAMADAAVKP